MAPCRSHHWNWDKKLIHHRISWELNPIHAKPNKTKKKGSPLRSIQRKFGGGKCETHAGTSGWSVPISQSQTTVFVGQWMEWDSLPPCRLKTEKSEGTLVEVLHLFRCFTHTRWLKDKQLYVFMIIYASNVGEICGMALTVSFEKTWSLLLLKRNGEPWFRLLNWVGTSHFPATGQLLSIESELFASNSKSHNSMHFLHTYSRLSERRATDWLLTQRNCGKEAWGAVLSAPSTSAFGWFWGLDFLRFPISMKRLSWSEVFQLTMCLFPAAWFWDLGSSLRYSLSVVPWILLPLLTCSQLQQMHRYEDLTAWIWPKKSGWTWHELAQRPK